MPYIVFFFIAPIKQHFHTTQWLLTLLAVAIFLPCYFGVYRTKGKTSLALACAIAMLGLIYTPFNGGAVCFFIYAGAFFGFCADAKLALRLLLVLVATVSLQAWIIHSSLADWLSAIGFSIMTGLININFRQRMKTMCELRMAREEVETLAKIAERERIARDLHDILGHTLSVIILKSELASKLIDNDVERARSEILDVERTSREALAEVRQAIGGYRAHGLQAEIEKARGTLTTAGLRLECEAPKIPLTATQESVLALAVRESITNIVRHANATACRLEFGLVNGVCQLRIWDDGCGAKSAEGNGLRGMRERVEALGGSLHREVRNGTRLEIRLPLNNSLEAKAS